MISSDIISSGGIDNILKDLYIDESQLEYQRKRYINALNRFTQLYGEGDVLIFSAPGRSEIGGNHTDHQCGRVLAASINLDAIAIVAKKESGIVLKSEGYPMINVSLADLLPTKEEEGTSAGLIRGVAARLKEEGYEKTMVSMQGIGYRQVFEYLEGNLSLEDTIEQIKKDTRHFAKRQLTWFGREKEVCMVDKSQFGSEDEILTYMLTILKEKGIYDGSVKELL